MNTTNNKVWLKYFIGKHATAWIKGKDNLSKLSDHFEYITLLSLLSLYCYIMYLYTVRGNLVLMGVSLELTIMHSKSASATLPLWPWKNYSI